MHFRMTSQIDWSLWRSFLAVAECGSLSAAARALGLAQPTVGRHIAELEERVGAALFARSRNGLLATELATSLVPFASAMKHSAEALGRHASARPDELRGAVRITASHAVANEVLPYAIGDLLTDYPHLRIELVASNDNADINLHEADLAIRMRRPDQPSLISRALGRVPLGLFAHEDYLRRRGRPRSLSELAGHTIIGPDRDPALLKVLDGLPLDVRPAEVQFATDSEPAQIAAVRAGTGIGLLQVGIAMLSPGLQQVFPEDVRPELDAWMVLHPDLRSVPRVRVVADYLARALPSLLRSAGV